MKIFEYNPTTGRRGQHIDDAKRLSWAGTSVSFLVERGGIEPIEYAEPVGFGSDANVTVHSDAGIGIGEDEISYRHPTEWRCMCIGQMMAGTDSFWDWVVLPPTSAIKPIEK